MPPKESVERALELIKKPGGDANYVHFFTRLTDSDWIEPLVRAGFFTSPPDPRAVGEGVAYPSWPESGYLLRVVDDAPEKVATVLERIPLNDNPRVHADLARIASRLSREAAVKFVQRELTWLAGRHTIDLDLPDALAELAVHLAEADATRLAVQLATELMAVRVLPGREANWPGRLDSRIDSWQYRNLVVQLAQGLQPWLGVDAIALVGDALDQALRSTSSEPPFDYSQIWRRTIRDESELYLDDPRQALITALRDVALQHTDEDRERLDEALDALARYDWTVFSRVAVDLLAQKAHLAVPLAVERTLDRTNLNSIEVALEYVSLLRAVYPLMDEAQRRRWLALIAQGPTWPDEEARARNNIDDDMYAAHASTWRRNWLGQVRGFLPPEELEELEQLETRYGSARSPAAVGEVTTWTGPTSPLTSAQLAEMTPTEIALYLHDWSPSGEPMSPTPEGLARLLTERIAAEPGVFADAAASLSALEPTYVRATIQGLEKAAREGDTFAWEPVIDLLESVIARGPGEHDAEVSFDYDVDWTNARGAIADLLRAALTNKTLPPGLGGRVWTIIEELSWDEQPTPEYEERYGGSNMDPLTLSLNTPRGKAMHTVLAFAKWRKELSTGGTFSLSSETAVHENLVAHLDPLREPSRTVRGVFGSALATLLWIDREWLAEHLPEIFPTAPEAQALRAAAWESYLSYGGHPYHLFPLLESEYRRALDDLGSEAPEQSSLGRDPAIVLAEHLGTFYYNGLIGLEEGGLLDSFRAAASPKLRAHLVEFLGRALHQAEEEKAPDEAIGRALALWGWLAERTPAEERNAVLADFGWWYAAEVLDRGWRTRELVNLLRAGIPVGPDFLLVKATMPSAASELDTTLEIIYLYVQSERDHWRLVGLQDELGALLTMGATGDDTQREKTRDIIDLLTAKGYPNHADVLHGVQAATPSRSSTKTASENDGTAASA